MSDETDDTPPESKSATATETATAEGPRRLARHVQPLGPRVLVRVIKSPDRSEAGLFLPQGVKDEKAAALLGEVVEVARTMPSQTGPVLDLRGDDDDDDPDDDDDHGDLGKNVSGVPLGANVLFEKERGVTVPWDDNLRLLEVRHVLAIVDIITEDEIQ